MLQYHNITMVNKTQYDNITILSNNMIMSQYYQIILFSEYDMVINEPGLQNIAGYAIRTQPPDKGKKKSLDPSWNYITNDYGTIHKRKLTQEYFQLDMWMIDLYFDLILAPI